MKSLIGSKAVLEAALEAAIQYVDLVTDRDPDDGEHVVPGELRRFMGRLRLLHGVPFSYLVPDAKLLPVESIRFFYIDRAWTDALVQGALSVGTVSSADRAQLEAVYPHIRAEVDAAERAIRRPQREDLLHGGAGTITGFLLRSRAVSGWPNLHVRAYSRDILEDDVLTTEAESHPSRMKVLRLERLAPAVLLVLFDGVPEVVHIEEPRQGIQFGARIDPEDPVPGRRKVKVRDRATGDPVAPKGDFTTANAVNVPFRPNAPGVINMKVLAERLKAKAPVNGTVPASPQDLEPKDYALQVLRFPYRQVFGDPSDSEGVRFYDLDRFRATVALTDWRDQVVDQVSNPGNPP